MKKVFAMMLSLTMIMGIVSGCDVFGKDRKDKKSKESSDVEDEDDEDQEEEEETVETIAADDDSMAGLWFDSHGPFMNVDPKNNTIDFIREEGFKLLSIEDDGFHCVRSSYDTYGYSYSYAHDYVPLYSDCEFVIPFTLTSDGHMDLMGYDLFRADSKEGEEVIHEINERLIGQTFEDGMFRYTFSEDYIDVASEEYSESFKISYDKGVITSDEFGSSFWTYIPDIESGEIVVCLIDLLIDNSEDRSAMQILMEDEPMSYDPETGTITKYSLNDKDDLQIMDSDGNVTETLALEEEESIYMMFEDSAILMLTGSRVMYSAPGEEATMDLVNAFHPWTIYGIALAYKNDVVNGKINNKVFETNVLDFYNEDNKVLTAEINIGDADISDVWLPDLANICVFPPEYFAMYDYGYDSAQLSYAIGVYTMTTDKITISLSTETDCEEEFISVVEQNSGAVDADLKLTKTSSGYDITYTITKPGTYVVCDTRQAQAKDQVVTPDVLLEMDPAMSYWALTQNTGDIISLVDLDYIEDSIFDFDNGSADFWVSTPEELASVVYYVNALSVVDGKEVEVMYYVHLMNDIDLEGYEWASLGYESFASTGGEGCEYMFRGVFFGNGYSIKNMTLGEGNDSFIDNCHLATIIGLTLDHPKLNGNSYGGDNCFIAAGQCITEVFDCHVILDGDEGYEFSSHDNGSINFFDCSMIVGGKEEVLNKEDYNSLFYNGVDNWIRAFYQPKGTDYKYDAKTEYETYLKDSDAFDKMYYYYGMDEEATQHVGYLDFRGWWIDDQFYLNFGYVYEE